MRAEKRFRRPPPGSSVACVARTMPSSATKDCFLDPGLVCAISDRSVPPRRGSCLLGSAFRSNHSNPRRAAECDELVTAAAARATSQSTSATAGGGGPGAKVGVAIAWLAPDEARNYFIVSLVFRPGGLRPTRRAVADS